MQQVEMESRGGETPAEPITEQEDQPVASNAAGAVLAFTGTNTRRWVLVLCTFLLSFASTYSSTALFPALPQISAEFDTTATTLAIANSGYLATSAVSPFFWTPINAIVGRRNAYLAACIIFALASAGTALSKNITSFIVCRCLSSLENSYFLMAGQSLIGDIFDLNRRGTAIGLFLAGVVLGPGIGPLVGAVVVTKWSWRSVFWIQTGLVGVAFVLAFCLFPDLRPRPKWRGFPWWPVCNPMRIGRLMYRPNLLLNFIACGTMSFTFYSLLTPIIYIVNPRFNFTSPIQAGVFYLYLAAGLAIGAYFGGRWSDMTIRRYMKKRNNEFIPEDRLNAGLVFTGVGLPLGMLLYGWSLERKVGGMAAPIIGIILAGISQMLSFSALNTYCTEIMPEFATEVVGGKYAIQYIFSTAGSVSAFPALNTIGIGWSVTICVALVWVGTACVWATSRYGAQWRASKD